MTAPGVEGHQPCDVMLAAGVGTYVRLFTDGYPCLASLVVGNRAVAAVGAGASRGSTEQP